MRLLMSLPDLSGIETLYGPYLKLALAAFLPVVLSLLLYLLDKKTPFGKIPYAVKQILYGILFGGLAIVGTEFGIPLNGAQSNCRDAAVLAGGLLFGAPAGIIAGLIGGIERWFAVYWGVGTFTRVACSVSTILAGFYAAALRKFMFENKKPGWLISGAIGVVMEVFHLTMVFITNLSTPDAAMAAVKACTFPMVLFNGVSVLLSAMVVSFFRDRSPERGKKTRYDQVRISQTIQRWLLVTVLLAFAVTSYFVFALQDTTATVQTDSLLTLAGDELSADIRDATDSHLLSLAHEAEEQLTRMDTEKKKYGFSELYDLSVKCGLTEISVVSPEGIIVNSSVPNYVGFDMRSGAQSAEFLCLLNGEEEFVQDYRVNEQGATRKYAGVPFGDGFIQVGYDAELFQRDLSKTVEGITKNRHVGKTGYILILDEDFEIVSAPEDFQSRIALSGGGNALTEENVTVRMTVCGEDSFCRYRISEGYYIVSVLPAEEALQMRNIALYVNSFMEVLVFAVLFALIYLLIKKVVVNQIKNINSSLSKITGGDLNEVVNVRSNAEFASLSDDINSTVDTLKRYIAEASARIDKELEFAKSIQASALPNVFPAFPKRKDFDIFASMNPAKEVGGDFYDFYMTGDDKLHFLIADVSGKGIPAAMFMMRAKTELKTLTEAEVPLSEVFTHGNEALCEGNDAGMFVTAWQGGLDLSTGKVCFANAGHNPPLVRHADGKFEYLRSKVGFVLAGMDGVRYKAQELQMEPGDTIYLYTDGVTEAQNANGELFGEDRLLEAINAKEFSDMKELCTYVRAQVDAFVGEAPQFDDITMVALKYIGTPPVPAVHFDAATLEDIPAVTEFVEAELEKLDCPMKTVVQFNIAVDELFSNIVRYGYPEDKPGAVTVEVIAKDDPRSVSIRFTDEGVPYNPVTKEDPDVTLSAEDRKIGGLGIFMVKKSMDDMRYKYEDGKNILTITKNL